MCGIVGILRLSGRPLPSPRVVRAMMSSIAYRGPDDTGEFISEEVHLGVVRLAIVDPKEGSQPVRSCTDQATAVYNGEIYNHHSLRQKLRRDGHSFSSQCDSEVIPHLYEESGIDLVQRLRGMFAFALWDHREKRLLLARDRVGIKPLFYAATPDYLVFGSEIKAIISSGLVEPEIDTDSLDDVFSMSYPCPPRTMFRGIRELLPAHVLTAHADRREIRETRYWRSPTPPAGEHRKISRDEAAEELLSLLRLKIYDHTMADVPVAAYLSGGLDSSAICGIMKNVSGDAPETFSVSFDSAVHDEYEFARRMADHIGSENHQLRCDASIAAELERMVWHTELPLQFPLALPMMKLAELAKANRYPVVLTGEGADELMGGYDCFRADKMRRMLDRPGLRFLRPVVYQQLYKWLKTPAGAVDIMLDNQMTSREIEQSFGGILPPWYDVWSSVGIDRQQLLGSSGRIVRPVSDAPEGFDALLPDDVDRLHPLDAGILLEQATRLPSWILLIADRAAMAEGVESRVPFLDHEIVEFVASLPPSYKMQGLQEKAVLRRATGSMMPKSLNERRKRPFYTPIREWFFSSCAPDFVEEALSPDAIRDCGLFDAGLVKQYRREIRVVPEHTLMRNRLEWTLLLILQTQILHKYFVRERCMKVPTPDVVT
jgi:asparagine synthase (glutamine-hydrolysing)